MRPEEVAACIYLGIAGVGQGTKQFWGEGQRPAGSNLSGIAKYVWVGRTDGGKSGMKVSG